MGGSGGGNQRQTPVLGGVFKLYLKQLFHINKRKWEVKKTDFREVK